MNNLIKNLYIIATPIGNLDDISSRSILTLQSVDYIICENITKLKGVDKVYTINLLPKF